MISFDVNLRPLLWDDLARARREIATALTRCQLAKLSIEEVCFLLQDGNKLDAHNSGKSLLAEFPNIKLLAVTMGAEGSLVLARNPGESLREVRVPAKRMVAVDTTGAGDTYCAALLHRVLAAGGLEQVLASEATLREAANFSGNLASYSVMDRGAVTIHRR
jgi:fructokinase